MLGKLANPNRFFRLTNPLQPVAALLSVALLLLGLWHALAVSPPDYQQGETVRIMYIHVPAAWLALFIYTSMAVAAICSLIWGHILADIYNRAAAPLGIAMTLLCLITGSLWGEPMWGTWWVWDARLTSMLVLLFLYLGYIALVRSFNSPLQADKSGNILLIVGLVNIPIIKFSVDWWATLHQPASIIRLDGPTIDKSMLAPLFIMIAAFSLGYLALVLVRVRAEYAARKVLLQKLRVIS